MLYNSENRIISEKDVHSNMHHKSNAMSSSPQAIPKRTGTVKNSATHLLRRPITKSKRKATVQRFGGQ